MATPSDIMESVQSLNDAYEARQKETRANAQPLRVRRVYRGPRGYGARVEARRITSEQSHEQAERRKQRRIQRAEAQALVSSVRKIAAANGEEGGYNTSGQVEKPNRGKALPDPSKVAERLAKRQAFEDKRNRTNFVRAIALAFASSDAEAPTKLPRPEGAKASWFPVRVTADHTEDGRPIEQTFPTLESYKSYHRDYKGRPVSDAAKRQIEKIAALNRAHSRRTGGGGDEGDYFVARENPIDLEDYEGHKLLGAQNYAMGGGTHKSRADDNVGHGKRVSKATIQGRVSAFRQKGPKGNRDINQRIKREIRGHGKKKSKPPAATAAAARPSNEVRLPRPITGSDGKMGWLNFFGAIEAGKMKFDLAYLCDCINHDVQHPMVLATKGSLNKKNAAYLLKFGVDVLRQIEPKANSDMQWAVQSVQQVLDARKDGSVKSSKVSDGDQKMPAPSAPPLPPSPRTASVPSPSATPPPKPPRPPNLVTVSPPAKPPKPASYAAAVASSNPVSVPSTQSAASAPTPPVVNLDDYPGFLPAAPPRTRTLFNATICLVLDNLQPEVVAGQPNVAIDMVSRPTSKDLSTTHYNYDPMGAPYCGYVAVDLALKNVENEDNYKAQIKRAGQDFGLASDIESYARSKGANLVIYEYDLSKPCFQGRINPEAPTVILSINRKEKHYYLVCECAASNNDVGLPVILIKPRWNLLISRLVAAVCAYLAVMVFAIMVCRVPAYWFVAPGFLTLLAGFDLVPTVDFSQPFYGLNDHDVRPILDRRDAIEMQASYSWATMAWHLKWFSLHCFSLPRENPRLITLTRFHAIHAQAQVHVLTGRDPTTLYDLVLQYRGDNTDQTYPSVYRNTAQVAVWLAQHVDGTVPKETEQRHCVAFNAIASFFGASEKKLDMFHERQNVAGFGNAVMRAKSHLSAKCDREIAWCSLPIISDEGQIGPGYYPVGDGCSLLAAFAMRSMCGPEPGDLSADFVEWSKKFITRFVTEVGDLGPEPDARASYAEAQRGKKPQSTIQQVVENYDSWLSGRKVKNFDRDSCFVKFENSAKFEDGQWGVKPRLIMTMSDLKAVECSPVLRFIEQFNHTSFSRYQVKGMTPEEMRDRIEVATNRLHNVSDYSSFEASIDATIREIEIFVMVEGLKRAGWYRTANAVDHYSRPHKMKTPELTFTIHTRCSGDYWTSFGNGIVNVCIMAYCAHLKGLDPYHMDMIAEGDDGIVPSHIPDADVVHDLGFKYSSNVAGSRPGDADFLRSRWIGGKRYLDVGRCFSACWLKKGVRLSEPKRKFLIRCVANSMHHLSPGHPIIAAIVCRLRRESEGWRSFRGYQKYLDVWSATGYKNFQEPKGYCYHVDESMRAAIAAGAQGFPPISIPSQLELERTLLEDASPYVGDRLKGYADFDSYVASRVLLQRGVRPLDRKLRALTDIVGSVPDYK